MLEQFRGSDAGTLAPALLVMSPSVMLTVGEGRDKPISSHWRLIGLIVGLIAAIVFAGLRASAVINQRTFVNYPVLWCAIIADILTIVVVVFARRITTNWQQHKVFMHIANAVAAIDIALTLFYALPDVILQLTIWVEPGETAFTSAMLLRALGFLLGVAMSIIVAAIFRIDAHHCRALGVHRGRRGHDGDSADSTLHWSCPDSAGARLPDEPYDVRGAGLVHQPELHDDYGAGAGVPDSRRGLHRGRFPYENP